MKTLEELGYVKTKDTKATLEFRKKIHRGFKKVVFSKDCKYVTGAHYFDNDYSTVDYGFYVDVELCNAITLKMKELGWIE